MLLMSCIFCLFVTNFCFFENAFANDLLIETLKCKANNKFVWANTIYVIASAGDIYVYEPWEPVYQSGDDYAYRNRETRKYLTVLSDGTVRCEAASIGTNEKFDQISVGSGYYALRSHRNNQYVNANHTNQELKADAANYTSDWTQFYFYRVVDMALVLDAFAANYSTSAKHQTYCYHSGVADYNNDYVMERYNYSDFSNYVMCWRNASDRKWIYDTWVLGGDFWGINGTFPDSTVTRSKMLPYIKISKRYIGPQDIGQTWWGNWDRYNAPWQNPCAFEYITTSSCPDGVLWFGTYNFGYDMGTRWFVELGTIDGYGFDVEGLVFDLGPAENNFDPEYGLIRYYHFHQNGDVCDEIYSDITSTPTDFTMCDIIDIDR